MSPRSSSSPFRARACTWPRRSTGARCRSSAEHTEPCWCSTRCRPVSGEPESSSASSTGVSSRTSSRCPRRCRVGSSRSAPCSRPTASSPRSTARSRRRSSTRPPSDGTSWPWWPASPHWPPSTTRTSSSGPTKPGWPSRRRWPPWSIATRCSTRSRGKGLMIGLQFGPPKSKALRRRFNTLEHLRPAIFSQMMVVPLFHRHRILTQVAADNVEHHQAAASPHLRPGGDRLLRRRARRRAARTRTAATGLLFEFGRTMAKGALRRPGKARPDAPYQPPAPSNGERERRPRPSLHGSRATRHRGDVMTARTDHRRGDRVVVTGAAGFIGSAVVRALLPEARQVVALVEPGGDETEPRRASTSSGSRSTSAMATPSPMPAPARDSSSTWRRCTGSGPPNPGLLRRQRRRSAQHSRGRPARAGASG